MSRGSHVSSFADGVEKTRLASASHGAIVNEQPLVSVLMPAFNSASYIVPALRSILSQSYRRLEVIVVDDASEDETAAIVEGLDDGRVRLYRNSSNSGIAAVRNKCVELATGDLLAWMDSDDVSLPTRIEKQVRFLQRNPEIAAVGSDLLSIDTIGSLQGLPWVPPLRPAPIAWGLVFATPFFNPTTMARADLYDKVGTYDLSLVTGSDNEFWVRCAQSLKLANLKDVLLLYRRHPSSISVLRGKEGASLGPRLTKHSIERILKKDVPQRVAEILRTPERLSVGDLSVHLPTAIETLEETTRHFLEERDLSAPDRKAIEAAAALLHIRLALSAVRIKPRIWARPRSGPIGLNARAVAHGFRQILFRTGEGLKLKRRVRQELQKLDLAG